MIYIPSEEYQPDNVKIWSTSNDALVKLLDVAQENIKTVAMDMGLMDKVIVIRKSLAVGMYMIFR